jgi:hypothetical protein
MIERCLPLRRRGEILDGIEYGKTIAIYRRFDPSLQAETMLGHLAFAEQDARPRVVGNTAGCERAGCKGQAAMQGMPAGWLTNMLKPAGHEKARE